MPSLLKGHMLEADVEGSASDGEASGGIYSNVD